MRGVRGDLLRWPMRRRVLVALASLPFFVGIVGGLGWAAFDPPAGALVGLSLGMGALSLLLSFLIAFPIAGNLRASLEDTRDLVILRPLLGEIPAPFGGFAVDGHLARILADTVIERRPSVVVECGSGTSTLILARCLKLLGRGKVVSLEHELRFREKTQQLLQAAGLDRWAEVVLAPLQEVVLASGEVVQWYSPTDDVPDSIDLLIVDGPPESTSPMARYPALPILHSRMAREALIVLDDGNRPDETTTARRWAREFGGGLTLDPKGRGVWRLQLHGGNASQ